MLIRVSSSSALLLLLLLILLRPSVALPESQQAEQEKEELLRPNTATVRAASVLTIAPSRLPEGENAWVVRIVSRGGIAGWGSGNLVIKSEGTIAWSGADRCSSTLDQSTTEALTNLVYSIQSDWGNIGFSWCLDCFVTNLVVQRREPDGTERLFSATWDDGTQAILPDEVAELYRAFMAYTDCDMYDE